MCRCLPGRVFAPLSLRAAAAARTSFTSVLLPEPETPVTQVRRPTGKPGVDAAQVVLPAPRAP